MIATELFVAPGTSEQMEKLVRQLPPYDLLKAYRDAQVAFNSSDVVLVVPSGDPEGFYSMPRAAYIEKAFARWDDQKRKLHPICRESAHRRLKSPADTPAWWLVIEFHDDGATGFCAVGAYQRAAEQAVS